MKNIHFKVPDRMIRGESTNDDLATAIRLVDFLHRNAGKFDISCNITRFDAMSITGKKRTDVAVNQLYKVINSLSLTATDDARITTIWVSGADL